MTEQQRLIEFTHQEVAPSTALIIEVQQVQEPAACLAKLVTIMQGVLSVPAELWDEDAADQWESYLPSWFVTSMKQFTVAQIMVLPGQWGYESWVATICARQWEWWSSTIGPASFSITLDLLELPYNAEPLFYAIKASCPVGYAVQVTENF
ncbi:MAG: hypothetical protein ACRYFX_24550 [Janthinobacterium lividum]